MNKVPLYSSKVIINALSRGGFESYKKSKGGHLSMKKKVGKRHKVVVIPMAKKEIPRGTFYSILKQAGCSLEDFLEWL